MSLILEVRSSGCSTGHFLCSTASTQMKKDCGTEQVVQGSKCPGCALLEGLFLVCGLLVLFVFSNYYIKEFTIYDLPHTREKCPFTVLDSQVCYLRRVATSGLYLSFTKSITITRCQQTYTWGNAIHYPAPEYKLFARERLSWSFLIN